MPPFLRGLGGSLVGRSGIVLAARVGAMVAGLAVTVAVTRDLGLEHAGVYFIALAAVQLGIVVGQFGMETAVLAEMPVSVPSGDRGRVRALAREATITVAVASSACAAVLVVAAPLLAGLFGSPDLVAPLRIMALAIIPTAIAMVRASMLVAVGRLSAGVIIQGPLVPTVVLAAFLPLAHLGLVGIAIAHAVGAVVGLVVAVVVWRGSRPYDGQSHGSIDAPSRLRQAGRSLVALEVFNYVGSHGDVLLLGALGGVRSVAVYAVSVRVAKVLSLVIESANTAVAPELSRLFRQGRMTELARMTGGATWALAGVAAVVYAVLIVFADPVLALFGEGFPAGRAVLLVVALGAALNVATGPNGLVLKMTAGESVVRNIGGISLLVHLVTLAVIAPLYGGLGAAWARTGGVALNNGLCLVAVRRRLGVNMFRGTVVEPAGRGGRGRGR